MGVGKIVRGIMKFLGKDEAIRQTNRLLNLDGGPGSGNFGHKGRPGKVGGSGEGGGSAFRTTSGGTYVGVQKAAAFNGIKKVAQKSKDAHEFIDSLDKGQRDMVAAQYRQSGSKEGIMNYTERLRQLMCSQKPQKTVPYKMVEGKNISETAEWDGKAYTEPKFGQVIDTEIENAIVQQGFNGPPKVVSQKEIMDIIDKHPEMPVLFRSYAALGDEAIQAYDDMLENGEWYVDCSNGGAQYGQGMYCAGVYGSSDYSGALEEMQHYRSVSMKNARARWFPQLEDGEDQIQVDGKSVVFRQADMKKTGEAKPPEAVEVVAMVKSTWTVEAAKGYFMPADPEDPDSPLEFTYYDDEEGHKTIPADKVPYWGPISRTETPPAASASTRMMTLDPSSKIISYKDLVEIGRKSENIIKEDKKRRSEEEDQFFGEELTDDATCERILYRTMMGMGAGDLSSEAIEKVVAWKNSHKERLAEITEFVNQQNEKTNKAREEAKKYERFASMDPGVLATYLGYDAINAEGHGETNSYTVVLNRTKLIISQSRVDMAS